MAEVILPELPQLRDFLAWSFLLDSIGQLCPSHPPPPPNRTNLVIYIYDVGIQLLSDPEGRLFCTICYLNTLVSFQQQDDAKRGPALPGGCDSPGLRLLLTPLRDPCHPEEADCQ